MLLGSLPAVKFAGPMAFPSQSLSSKGSAYVIVISHHRCSQCRCEHVGDVHGQVYYGPCVEVMRQLCESVFLFHHGYQVPKLVQQAPQPPEISQWLSFGVPPAFSFPTLLNITGSDPFMVELCVVGRQLESVIQT